jgi:hypothetical protein
LIRVFLRGINELVALGYWQERTFFVSITFGAHKILEVLLLVFI